MIRLFTSLGSPSAVYKAPRKLLATAPAVIRRMSAASWSPTQVEKIVYGEGSIKQIPDLLKAHLADRPRPIILSTRSLGTTSLLKDIESLLQTCEGGFAGTFTSIGQHAPVEGIKEIVQVVRKQNVNCIVSLGGGSPIDAAKVVSHFLNKELQEQGSHDTPYVPSLAVPTTLSAAEFGSTAGYTLPPGTKEGQTTPQKTGIADPRSIPKVVVLDPKATIDTPLKLLTATGIRALDHAIEGFVREGMSEPMRVLAIAATRDLLDTLPKIAKDPDNLQLRSKAQVGAWMSFFPNKLPTPLGLSHTLGYMLGSPYSIPHGECSAITLPSVIRLYASTFPPRSPELASLDDAATRIGAPAGSNPTTWLADEVQRVVDECGLKKSMKAHGVPEGDLEKIAKGALGPFRKRFEVVGGPKEEQVVEMLRQIYSS